MEAQSFDIVIIGAGPGGYVAAIRAAQLGFKVACVEKGKTLGGTCLNIGCIPSKALLESSELYAQAKEKFEGHGIGFSNLSLDFQKMMERKAHVVKQLTGGIAGLFKKNKITSIAGIAQIQPDKTVQVVQDAQTVVLKAPHVIVATGSIPASLPNLTVDHQSLIDSTDALALSKVPEKLVVIGGGYIGLELGSVYARLGAKVTVVEAKERIVPLMDQEVSQTLQKILKKQGFEFLLETRVKSVERQRNGEIHVTIQNKEGKLEVMPANVALMSVGRRPATEGLGLEAVGVRTNAQGQIEVNDRFETSIKGIYAIGDVIRGPMLAHKASEEGVAVVERIAGQAGHVNYKTIPSVIYTFPEVASVGATEEELKAQKIPYKVSKFPFLANGRALALGEKEGWVKFLADQKTDRLLGAHLIGPRVSDLIGEMVLGMEFGASGEDIARTVHAHPTLAETLKEAALGLGSGTIHI